MRSKNYFDVKKLSENWRRVMHKRTEILVIWFALLEKLQ
jgi:hypothetical protein